MLLAAGIERPRLLHACTEEPLQCGHCCDQKQKRVNHRTWKLYAWERSLLLAYYQQINTTLNNVHTDSS